MRAAIEAYFSGDKAVPADIARLGALAAWDLWYGPIAEPDDRMPWPGFTDACAAVAAWADEHLPDVLFYDVDAGFLGAQDPFKDPGYWMDPEGGLGEIYYGPEEVTRLERRDLLSALFDVELVRGGYLD